MGQIADNIQRIKTSIPKNISLVAVSKTKPNEDIMQAYQAGHLAFGENKVQDMVAKAETLPKDIKWHFIGHLQTNKIKYIAPFVDLIHAVDSWKLLKEINKQAKKNKRIISCLLQFHIADEDTKFGLDMDGVLDILQHPSYTDLQNIQIIGVMGMASFTSDQAQIQKEFSNLKKIFEDLKNSFFKEADGFKDISMGMSADYQIAVEQGSTIIRVGSSIFGARACMV
ncbi:MAG: YggS family pyridoxal phosphate-dependent enzyme [Bacteroidales bacterium]|nr:YggS family pyridoxal phosphate-dependent enzyme [Bacteroidales bacterium]